MFETIKNGIKLRSARKELRIKELELDIKRYDKAVKMLDAVESTDNEVVDTDLKSGWFLHGSNSLELNENEHQNMMLQANKLYHTNPYARAIIRNMVKFILGKGPRVIPKDETQKDKILEAWEGFKKDNKFNIKEKEICRRLFRDGEVFIRFFDNESEGKTKIRFIRPQFIMNPKNKELSANITHGIETDPEDIEQVISYYRCDKDGNYKERIKAEEVLHVKIFADSDQKRGISLLKIAAKRLAQYESWLDDRIVLNKVRSAIALVRTVTGTGKNVKSIRDENLSSRLPESKQKVAMPGRGTIITASKGIEYDMLSPNIQAADVKDDGRAMLLSIAASIGFPEMLLTADYSNANYASSLTAQNPFVREIEDWQDFTTYIYDVIFARFIMNKIKANKLPDNVDDNCEVVFPPIIQADIDKITKAFEILYKYRIVSRRTWRAKMDLDDDQEKQFIQDEDGEDGGFGNPLLGQPAVPGAVPAAGQPAGKGKLNMPISPINQYGQQILLAVKNKDWEEANRLANKIIELDEQNVEE